MVNSAYSLCFSYAGPRLLVLILGWLIAASVWARVPDFVDLVEKNSPSVVKIQTEQKVTGRSPEDFDEEDLPDIFRDLFERYGMPKQNPRGMGSGFIMSEDGYVVTNHHVVADADKVTVTLIDRREYTAQVVGTDSRSDLALLKIDAGNLPVVEFADVDQVRVGEWVIAIGSPFGLDYSASVGIVSAIGRSLPNRQGENYVPFIQSDVAINPGNSGGPLFNQDGKVVGINSQIYTRTGGSVGISFVIPISVAEDVIAQLKDKGSVERGWLGVYIQEVDPALAESLGLDSTGGALVAQVMPDSPAAADLKPGDVIVEFAGKAITESGDLPQVVGLTPPGTRAKTRIVRDGAERTLTIEVGALPAADKTADTRREMEQGDALGLSVQEIPEETAATHDLAGGVVVEKVYPNSPASYTRRQPGDVIAQLGEREIDGAAAYREAVDSLPEGVPVLIRILRQGTFIYRTIELAP